MEYKNILCPVDGSEILREKCIESASYLSKISGAKLILLNVVEKWYRQADGIATDSKEWQAIHKQWLDEGKSLLQKEEAKIKANGLKNIELILREGDASHEIIATAFEYKIDLIVMATHHYSTLGKIFIGSVTERVTKKSPCPVLWVFHK
ncbi:MAG: universal stress protein [Spirochaetota bacterium]|nr:universal stress protein [Spirochaetota bacterium]